MIDHSREWAVTPGTEVASTAQGADSFLDPVHGGWQVEHAGRSVKAGHADPAKGYGGRDMRALGGDSRLVATARSCVDIQQAEVDEMLNAASSSAASGQWHGVLSFAAFAPRRAAALELQEETQVHMILVMTGGAVLLGLFVLFGHLWGASTAAMALAARWFIPAWLVIASVNMWVGVTHAGYTVKAELPILGLVFAVPALLAAGVAWYLSKG